MKDQTVYVAVMVVQNQIADTAVYTTEGAARALVAIWDAENAGHAARYFAATVQHEPDLDVKTDDLYVGNDDHIDALKERVDDLREEIEQLKAQNASLNLAMAEMNDENEAQWAKFAAKWAPGP